MLLMLPLIAAAWFFGAVCRRMEAGHVLLVFAVPELLHLVRDVLLALALLALAAGIVVLLFRPLWLAAVAFGISALALLLSWGVTVPHLLLVLLFFVAALAHAAITQRDVTLRISFSTGAVGFSQPGFLVALLLVVAAALYLGSARYARQEGFSIPAEYADEFAEHLASRVAAAFPSLIEQQVYDSVREHTRQLLTTELQRLMKPVTPYVPIAAALALFLPLLLVCLLLSWGVMPVLWLLFELFRVTGVTRVATETIEVQRRVLI